MKKVLLNISNHPSSTWSEEQKKGWDRIQDYPFPLIDPHASEQEIDSLVWGFFRSVIRDLYTEYRKGKRGWSCEHPEKNRTIVKKLLSSVTFHVAGEWSFTFAFVTLVKSYGGRCVVACSDRQTIEEIVNGQTHKKVIFEFVRWRKI